MAQKVTATETAVVPYQRPAGCTEYCGRYVHVHVQGESLAHDLCKMGQIAGLGGLGLMKMACSSSFEAPLASRVFFGGLGAVTSVVGSAACLSVAGVAYVGETAYGFFKTGSMELTAEDVRELRCRLEEQQQIFNDSDQAVKNLDLLREEVLPN